MLKICPTSDQKIDSKLVRLISFSTLFLVFFGYFFSYWVFLFLATDFLLRFFSKFSPLKKVSQTLIKILQLKTGKKLDWAPKRFSALLGFLFSGVIFLLTLFNFVLAANTLILIFLVAIFLEAFFGYCAGCKFYSLIQNIKIKNKK